MSGDDGLPTVEEVAELLAAIRGVMHLDDDDPRRVEVMAEKHRLLAAIELAAATPAVQMARELWVQP